MDEDILFLVCNILLLISVQSEGCVIGQDILVVVWGDYVCILGVFYDQGYFLGLIDIKLDGVEVVQIVLLDVFWIVCKVQVSVDFGLCFCYSCVEIGLLVFGIDLFGDYCVGGVVCIGDMMMVVMCLVICWCEVGYVKVVVGDDQIIVDYVVNIIDSCIVLVLGFSLIFGKFSICGYDCMFECWLCKIVGFFEGQCFDFEKLEDVCKCLWWFGVFLVIMLSEVDYVGFDNMLDVDLLVVEQKLCCIGGGFEFLNIEGLVLIGYWMYCNLLGGGERLCVDVGIIDIGVKDFGQDYNFGVCIDWFVIIMVDMIGYVEVIVIDEQEEDYDQKIGIFGLGFIYQFSDEFIVDIGL